ncbi:hypothetical protein Sbal183_0372 [Shewanella baltica OS183]|uniref:hypothetical protein n=1 Tax=Shewanella baltica TaxID=62322 RepID=UPI0001E108B8|nr:hypothetical protein [Shewanella baltica]AEG13144.1 hypothetical protein Sbal175_3922 [Shewanella baltica BA175]EHQ13311.1 hypothetical protein Sbal183_0372 [Shewanella baltica OS183]
MKYILMIATLALLQACAMGPQFYVNIDSISAPEAVSKTKYILLPGVKDVEEGDLQYREYATYVDRALALKGYTKATSFSGADIAIFLGYGVGDPITSQFTYSLPTFGQTGVSSANTYGTVNRYGNTATYSGTTTYTPTYGVTGSTTHTGTQTTYFRYMWLDAVNLDEYRKTEKEIQLWKTTVSSTGSSGDLRQVFPILVAASKPHIGGNTGKEVEVVLSEDDKRVTEIKGLSQ